jgi:hypothetical protein
VPGGRVELERIAIALRPRGGWEAVDLGLGMARQWWRLCFGAWWVPFLPIAIALHLAFWESPLVALLVLWWLKPLFDRFVLYALSRRCFGEDITLAQLLGAWRSILSPSLLWALTLGRLSPARSYMLPVSVLERQTGKHARDRRRLLARRFYANGSGLTFICVNLELVVQFGLSVLFAILLQPGDDPFTRLMESDNMFDGDWWTLTDSIYYLIAVGLIEPLYVAGGFSLYLNRRVILEGWDVELALKRLAARLPAALAPLLVVALLFGSVPPAQAQESASDPAYGSRCAELFELEASGVDAEQEAGAAEADLFELDPAELDPDDEDADQPDQRALLARCERMDVAPLDTPARQAITRILADPMFGELRQVERWRLRADLDDDEKDRDREDLDGFAQFVELLASLWQVLTWVVLALLLLYLGRAIARRWQGTGDSEPEDAAPTELFGLRIAPDSLPDDVIGTALDLLARGQSREALALLYRATLSQLVHAYALRLPAGATEGDVLRRARAGLGGPAQVYLAELVRAWVDLAYAERHLPADRLRALIEDHRRHFSGAAAGDGQTDAGASSA